MCGTTYTDSNVQHKQIHGAVKVKWLFGISGDKRSAQDFSLLPLVGVCVTFELQIRECPCQARENAAGGLLKV